MKLCLIRHRSVKGIGLCLSPQFLQKIQKGSGISIADIFLFPTPVFRQTVGFLGLKPQTGRKHRADCLIECAEIPFPDKCCQPQLQL